MTTPKEVCENRLKWALACYGAPKACGILTQINKDKSESDCCLGLWCRIQGVERQIYNSKTQIINKVYYDGRSQDLPLSIIETLNIDSIGTFTPLGHAMVGTLISNHINSLAGINDETFPDDKTLDRVGLVILNLWMWEYLYGDECFMNPSNQ